MSIYTEEVFINGGEIYKQQTPYNLERLYECDFDADPVFNFVKRDGKKYLITPEFKEYFVPSDVPPADLTGYPLAPAVTLWLALGCSDTRDKENFDLYFAIDNAAQLEEIAAFYELQDPSTPELRDTIDNLPQSIALYNAHGRHIVVGAVKYVNGVPTYLKLYTYPKVKDEWRLWMKGVAYTNEGTVYEEGAYFTRLCGGIQDKPGDYNGEESNMDEVRILAKRGDISVEYRFHDSESQDPFIGWAGFESDGRKRTFETCDHIHQLLGGYAPRGPHLAERYADLCPAAGLWFAHSHYGNPEEWAEVYFGAVDSEQVKSIADYYNLPTPLNTELAQELDSGNGRYRVRHYPLGEDDALVKLNAGSVIFENGKPVRILFYTFIRPWEFEEPTDIPSYLL